MNAFANLIDDVDIFSADLDVYELANEITTVVSGQWNHSTEIFNDTRVNVRWAFTDVVLSSISFRSTVTQNAPDGRPDFNATVVANRIMQIEHMGKWMPLSDFICQILRGGSGGTTHLSNESILAVLAQYHFDPKGRLPMYLQHLGAGHAEFEAIAEDFVRRGAVSNADQVRSRAKGKSSRVVNSYRHPTGIPIHSLEISKANRELSTNNSGFIGFGDAMWSTFTHALAFHRERHALSLIMNNASTPAAEREKAAAREAQIRTLFTTPIAARAFRNWGGTTEVKDVLDPNAPSTYYPQQVLCGRFTLAKENVAPLTPDTVYSVWTTSRANNTPASDIISQVAASFTIDLPESDGEAEPF